MLEIICTMVYNIITVRLATANYGVDVNYPIYLMFLFIKL